MTHQRKIAVLGLGYVGLPVAVEFGKLDRVIGFDIDSSRIDELCEGRDRTGECTPAELASTDIEFTSDPGALDSADFYIVAVPTPVDDAKRPDLGPILKASEMLGAYIKQGDIIVYESTVYPGATEEDCVPVLEHTSGLQCGTDFSVGYSPERINPGDKLNTFKTIIKVVSGLDAATLDVVADVYGSVVDAGVYRAPTIKVAEASKVIENTQRDLNISLMNELALIFNKMNIDTRDVLQAAGTKWNFLRFQPGLVGGHCISVDPYYLTHKAAMMGYTPQVILSGRSINADMGKFVAGEVVKLIINAGYGVRGSIVTILGLAFKEDVPDLRNTRVVDVVTELAEYSVYTQVHDPLVDPKEAEAEYGIKIVEADHLAPAHAVLLAVPHAPFKEAGWPGITSLLIGGQGVVVDVKAILPRETTPENVTLWRL